MYDGMKNSVRPESDLAPKVKTEVKPSADIKLYWSLASPPSRAVKALLVAGGIKHDEMILDIINGEHKKPEILKLNPLGTVPFITIKGKAHTES